jgi:hypothetical protein
VYKQTGISRFSRRPNKIDEWKIVGSSGEWGTLWRRIEEVNQNQELVCWTENRKGD